MIQDLSYHAKTMSRDDLMKFQVLEQRDKDDEDLDALSVQALERLHLRYMPKKSRKDVEDAWKKLTSKEKSEGSE